MFPGQAVLGARAGEEKRDIVTRCRPGRTRLLGRFRRALGCRGGGFELGRTLVHFPRIAQQLFSVARRQQGQRQPARLLGLQAGYPGCEDRLGSAGHRLPATNRLRAWISRRREITGQPRLALDFALTEDPSRLVAPAMKIL